MWSSDDRIKVEQGVDQNFPKQTDKEMNSICKDGTERENNQALVWPA